MANVAQIDVHKLKAMQDGNDHFVLLDVREPDEYEFCRLEGSILIPLGEIRERIGELDSKTKTVVMCRSGGRSNQAACFLKENGFEEVYNLAGGILAWSDHIDPAIPKY